jgi:hypothetical protein
MCEQVNYTYWFKKLIFADKFRVCRRNSGNDVKLCNKNQHLWLRTSEYVIINAELS